MSVRIRPMEPADCGAVAAIEKECFSQPWSRAEFENQLTLSIARTYVSEENGEVTGFINVWVVAGEINLNNIALTEKSRGRGLGRALIEHMEKNEQAQRCNLEVRVSNERAIRLYRSIGFEEVGLRKGFYSEPKEDALLMTKRYGETDGI